jgi:hypothetical protein
MMRGALVLALLLTPGCLDDQGGTPGKSYACDFVDNEGQALPCEAILDLPPVLVTPPSTQEYDCRAYFPSDHGISMEILVRKADPLSLDPPASHSILVGFPNGTPPDMDVVLSMHSDDGDRSYAWRNQGGNYPWHVPFWVPMEGLTGDTMEPGLQAYTHQWMNKSPFLELPPFERIYAPQFRGDHYGFNVWVLFKLKENYTLASSTLNVIVDGKEEPPRVSGGDVWMPTDKGLRKIDYGVFWDATYGPIPFEEDSRLPQLQEDEACLMSDGLPIPPAPTAGELP